MQSLIELFTERSKSSVDSYQIVNRTVEEQCRLLSNCSKNSKGVLQTIFLNYSQSSQGCVQTLIKLLTKQSRRSADIYQLFTERSRSSADSYQIVHRTVKE